LGNGWTRRGATSSGKKPLFDLVHDKIRVWNKTVDQRTVRTRQIALWRIRIAGTESRRHDPADLIDD